ncbi:uncharacterized protein UDID_18019 [Ustilago sp. UG-2017a]|nr:uncharacterized protein UDID_18019 [Ustilago sp. UG-2017a]
MTAWIADYVASCPVCARYKAPRHRPYGMLQPLATPDRPWGSISLDFIEGLPPSRNYDSILVIVDRLTKFAILAPTYKTVTAKQTAVLLYGHMVRLFGYPDHMVSDRGRQFISGAWKAFAEQMGVKHSLSTAYHPQTDGQTERVNQVVEQYLRMYCNYEQNDWADLLDTAAFVYNNTVHNSIGVSPFFACYGWNPKAHPDIPQRLGVNDPGRFEYLMDGKERCKYLQEQIREAQRRTVDQYNRKRKDIEFKVGDMVYINRRNWKTRQPTLKLDTRFAGPYPVQERIGRRAYRITLPANCHGPECSGSRRAPVESMAVVQSPWRPWTPTDSHAKEERAHMRGGPATKRTKLKEQAQPRRGQSSRSRHSHEEDQAQGACRWLPLRGSRDKSQRNHHQSKEEEQCIGDRQVGPGEEEQCRRSRHSSGGTGVPSKQDSKEEEQCRSSRHSSGGQEWC